MKIQKKILKDGEVQLEVALSRQECADIYQQSLKKVGNALHQKGFRDGKVPEKIILQTASDNLNATYEDLALKRSSQEALTKTKIASLTQPEAIIIKSIPGKIFSTKITFIPYPKIQLGQYRNLKVKKNAHKVTDKEIKAALEFLRQSRAKFQAKNTPAQAGDQLDISFEAFKGQKKIDRGSTKHYPLRLGKSHLHPDFEKQLYGTRPGDKKTFTIKFPPTWPQQEFRGKSIRFHVLVNTVQKVILPKLDDAFAQSLGRFSDLKGLKASLREGLKQEKEQEAEKELQSQIVKKIVDSSSFNIAQALVLKQQQALMQDLLARLSQQHLNLEDYLKQFHFTRTALEKNLYQQAQNMIKQAFVLYEIAKKEKLFPDQQEVEEAINEKLKRSQNYPQDLKNIDWNQLQSYTFEYLTNQKVIHWLIKKNICV